MTNEYADNGVTNAATEVIDGHEYAVLNLNGSITAQAVKQHVDGNTYAKVVLQEDCTYATGLDFGSNNQWDNDGHLIVDLRGYTLACSGGVQFNTRHTELWDSSPAGTGQMVARYLLVQSFYRVSFVMRGGTVHCSVNMQTVVHPSVVRPTPMTGELTLYGGQITDGVRFGSYSYNANIADDTIYYFSIYGGSVANGMSQPEDNIQVKTMVAPYIAATYTADGRLTAVKTYDAYAVSTTDLALGAYNYAYGFQWELSVAELRKLTIPTDKTYYLWGRDNDGWYDYLNLCYVDGAWQNAA